MTPDDLGRVVRQAWVEWAREQPAPKPSWLVPWEDLSEADQEADRRIGQAVAAHLFATRLTIDDEDADEDATPIKDSLADAVQFTREALSEMHASPVTDLWEPAFGRWCRGCDRIVAVALALVPEPVKAAQDTKNHPNG